MQKFDGLFCFHPELNLTLSAASICCKWRHLMWAGEHDRRVNSSPSDDSSVFRILFPRSEEKHIRRYAESNKLRSFRSSDGMNSTWACKRAFFYQASNYFQRVHVARELLMCTFSAPHLVPNGISFIPEDFETSNPFSCCPFVSISTWISSCFIFHHAFFMQLTPTPLALFLTSHQFDFQ